MGGLSPGVHSMVGIYSRNCPDWIIAEQGLYCYSMVNVPLYDSLGPEARAFVISECEMRIIVAFDESNLRSILSSAPACLKVIVTVRDVKPRFPWSVNQPIEDFPDDPSDNWPMSGTHNTL